MQIKDNTIQVTSELEAEWLLAHIDNPQEPNQKLADALARFEAELEKGYGSDSILLTRKFYNELLDDRCLLNCLREAGVEDEPIYTSATRLLEKYKDEDNE